MIDLHELRIGNFLEYEGKIVHVTMLSLDIDDEYQEIIGFCDLGKDTDEKSDWNRALADKLKMIPLTPSILEACGFVDGQKMFSYHTHIRVEPYQTLAQGIFPGEWSVTLLDTIPHRLGNSIKHVHQLQNLYHALTGSELQVNLKQKV